MNKEFIPYQQALELKELGFDEPCLAYFIELRNPSEGILTIDKCENNIDGVLAPTFSQAFRWFREKHKLDSTVALVAIGYGFYIHKNRNYTNKGENYGMYITYEEAELACLNKLIEIVKGGNNE